MVLLYDAPRQNFLRCPLFGTTHGRRTFLPPKSTCTTHPSVSRHSHASSRTGGGKSSVICLHGISTARQWIVSDESNRSTDSKIGRAFGNLGAFFLLYKGCGETHLVLFCFSRTTLSFFISALCALTPNNIVLHLQPPDSATSPLSLLHDNPSDHIKRRQPSPHHPTTHEKESLLRASKAPDK